MTKPGLFHARHKKMELLPSALNPITRVAIDAAAFGLLGCGASAEAEWPLLVTNGD